MKKKIEHFGLFFRLSLSLPLSHCSAFLSFNRCLSFLLFIYSLFWTACVIVRSLAVISFYFFFHILCRFISFVIAHIPMPIVVYRFFKLFIYLFIQVLVFFSASPHKKILPSLDTIYYIFFLYLSHSISFCKIIIYMNIIYLCIVLYIRLHAIFIYINEYIPMPIFERDE